MVPPPDEPGPIAFGQALIRADLSAVEVMLRVDPSLARCAPWAPDWEEPAIEIAASRCVFHRPGARTIVARLIEHGAECRFQTAARAGLLDRVRTMLAEDASRLDAADDEDRTALYRASCVYGKFEDGEAVADFLLQAGAELDFWTACTLGMSKEIDQLLEHDPTLPEAVDAEGMTGLHWAVRNRRHAKHAVAITERLLRGGADVHAINPSEDDMTAMHHVAEWCGHPEQVDLLLAHGADLNVKAKQGWTPLDYAIDRGRDTMAKHLRRLGARSSQQD